MKRCIKVFTLIFIFYLLFSIKICTNASEINQESVQIISTSTLDKNIECASSTKDIYSVLKGGTIRINYSVKNSNLDASVLLSDLYGLVVNHQSVRVDDSYTGYYDIQLIYSSNIIILLGINNPTTQALIAFDSLNLNIYDSIQSLELVTVNPIGFLNKTLIFNLKINNQENLYAPDLYMYYIDKNGDRIELINNFSKENCFTVTIDANLMEQESVDFYLTNDTITSLPLSISMTEVTYLEYVDVIDSDLTYCVLDDVVNFYARIPLNSNPDFVLIDKTDTVRLDSYSVIHTDEAYDMVCFKIKLLSTGSTECLLGFLSYGSKLNTNYTYKRIKLSVIEDVASLAFDQPIENIEYGDTVLYSPLINDQQNISCSINWYLDNELIYTGPSLNYVFYSSGNHVLRMEYNGLSSEINLYVAYSTNESIIWYVIFVIVLAIGLIALILFFRKKKAPLSKIERESIEIQNELKKLLETDDKRSVASIIKKITIFENKIQIINDSYDYLSIDSTVDAIKKVVIDLNRLKNGKDDLPNMYKRSIEYTIKDLKMSFSKKNMELLKKTQEKEE